MKSICRRGMSTAAAVAGVVGVLALGVAGYTMLSGECGLGSCSVSEEATVQTVAASKECSSCETDNGCAGETVLASAEKSECSQTCSGEVASACDGICDDLDKNQGKIIAASTSEEAASESKGCCPLMGEQAEVITASATTENASECSEAKTCSEAKACSDEKKSDCANTECPMKVATNN